MTDKTISNKENLALRGLCIALIVLHNLVHNRVPFDENEKWFNPDNADFFLNNILGHPVLGSISYLGWLGVPVFFFLSGYGLNRKYGNRIPNAFSFIKNHYLKLLLLAGPFILLRNIMRGSSLFDLLGQLTFLNNLFKEVDILPYSFWYFRIAFEFYILYALLLRHIQVKWLLAFSLVITCSFVFCNDEAVHTIKYHSIGWLLDFVLGVYVAQHGQWLKRIENVYCSLLFFVLLVFSSVNGYAWYFSSTIAVLFFLSIKRHITNRLMLFLGSISAFLYVTHSFIKDVWLFWELNYMKGNLILITLSICSYFLVCVLVAYLYSKLYNKVLPLIQGRFSRK